MKGKASLLLSSLKMSLATMTSRILGLVREQVMAGLFGASGLTDAFLIAYRIPNLFRDLLAEGAFSSAFVPVFTDAKNSGKADEAKQLLWSSFILLGSITATLSLLIYLLAPQIVDLMAPTFARDHAKFHSAVIMTQLMAPYLFFVSISALFMGVLNTYKVFFLPAMAPALLNIIIILSMILLPSYLTGKGFRPIYSLAIGVSVGGIAQFLMQVPALFKRGLAPLMPRKIFNKYSKEVVVKLGPGLIGFAATQLNLIINTILASSTIIGAVSWLSYAFRLFQFPVGILSVSLANSNLVYFAQDYKSGNTKGAIQSLALTYQLSFILLIPITFLSWGYSETIVSLVFKRGAFDTNDVAMTGLALKYYILGLPFYGLYKILVPTFYTLNLQKIPVYTSIGAIIFNIVFCIIFVGEYGFAILALGTSLSMLINSSVQAYFLKKHLKLDVWFYFPAKLLKVLICSANAYLLSLLFAMLFDLYFQASVFKQLCKFVLGFGIGLLTYVVNMGVLGERVSIKKLFKG